MVAAPTTPLDLAIEEKVDQLLAQLTLEEKCRLCHAGSKFAVAAIPRLGIPEFTMSDGPHGVRHEICRDSWDPVETEEDRSTYLPTGTALAATWNRETAYRFGTVLGAEARHRGKDIILGPGINIVRTPLCGRNFEYFGEDPFQISEMVVPEIEGIQSQGVAACVKHFAANNQELNRSGVDAQMDERTLREIYLPGFEAAVKEAKCMSVMGAYNKFHGQYCCQNEYLLNRILKQEWGFDGSCISDWAGVNDTFEAARNGCDIEMGTSDNYDEFYLGRPFCEAVEQGKLTLELLDDKVRRNLRTMFRIGIFDPERPAGRRNTPEHQRAAREIAQEGIVLLKNERSLLPLKRESLRKVVVIGENAVAVHASGGHSSGVKALYEITPWEALRNRLGDSVDLQFFQGYPSTTGESERIDTRFLSVADAGSGTHGWKATYWSKRGFTGESKIQAETTVDQAWKETTPFPGSTPGQFSATWETILTPPTSGPYEFVLHGTDQACLAIDGIAFIHRFDRGAETTAKTVQLEAGREYKLRVELWPTRSDLHVRLGWIPPWSRRGDAEDGEMQAAVQEADAVLFFGGLNHQYDLEGTDRKDLALHEGQNELIGKLSQMTSGLAVILISGSPVELPWLESVPAVVQMWYAGMEGGNAITDILLGEVNPSGKLPMTFPAVLSDSPAHALNDYAAEVCYYKEGLFVGYRWFDQHQIQPLFPFGHGLSYTQFQYEDLQVEVQEQTASVSLLLTNSGPVAGAEVIQVYVGQVDPSVSRPIRELKGFEKVFLQPGESRTARFHLGSRAFACWNTENRDWKIEPGIYLIEAGASSRDLRLRFAIAIR